MENGESQIGIVGRSFHQQRSLRIVDNVLFVETTVFTRHLSTHLDDNGFAALQAFLSVHPDAGPIVRGSGGIRKLRWGSRGRGKRGGSRVIYYWLPRENHIYLLTIYGKGVKQDLTAEETAAWRRVVKEIENG